MCNRHNEKKRVGKRVGKFIRFTVLLYPQDIVQDISNCPNNSNTYIHTNKNKNKMRLTLQTKIKKNRQYQEWPRPSMVRRGHHKLDVDVLW